MEKIPVIMCFWDRPERLPRTLELLQNQGEDNFKLYLWNNNPDASVYIKQQLSIHNSISSEVINSRHNIGGFGRFYYAKKLASQHQFVVFIDDDQEFSESLIGDFRNEAEPCCLKGFWAFKLNSSEDYWDRTPLRPGEEATYCGTGGIVADTSIFKEPALYQCPEKYWHFEDLWLSYFAKVKMNWKLFKSSVDMKIIDDGKDLGLGKEQTKSKFLQYLVEMGWKI